MLNPESSDNSQNPNEKEPVKVVLADDDRDDQETFSEALDAAKIPANLTVVEDGQELIDHLKDKSEPNPDIIFTDINMPRKGGKEALEEIKKDEDLKDIPIVVLSTSSNHKDIQETLNKGADLYVQKPNSFHNFILVLKKIFQLFWTKALLNPVKKIFFASEK